MKIQTNNSNPEKGWSAFYVWKALRELGHDALLSSQVASDVDLVFNIDVEYPISPAPGKPSIYWHTDSFYHEIDPQYIYSHLFIGGCPEDLKKFPAAKEYIPHAFDPEIHKPYEVSQDYDIVFCGHHGGIYSERNRVLDELKKRYNVYDTENFTDYAKEMSRGKLIFNKSLGEKNIPMRFFEGMAIGCLLQNYNYNLDAYATVHKHYIPYTDDADLFKKIDFYLSHEKERLQIALDSREHGLKFHTYKHRVERMLSYL